MMSAVFLSASVPNRGDWIETARPHEIRESVVALVATVLPEHELVFGGHPAISPLVEHAARSLGAASRVHIYQSRQFEGKIPEAALKFENFHWTDKKADQPSSLTHMRTEMLRSRKFLMAVFIGGMEGINDEFTMFREICPNKPAYAIGSTGSASAKLIEVSRQESQDLGLYSELSVSKLYRSLFSKLVRQAVTQEKTAAVLPILLEQDDRKLISSIWPVFKPLVSSGVLAGGSPSDVLEEWKAQVLLPACNSAGEHGRAILGLLFQPAHQRAPQKVAVVADFLRDVFRGKELRDEDLTGLAVALLRMGIQ